MNILLLTLVTDHLAVFFASGIMTFTAGESVLFVLQSRISCALMDNAG